MQLIILYLQITYHKNIVLKSTCNTVIHPNLFIKLEKIKTIIIDEEKNI